MSFKSSIAEILRNELLERELELLPSGFQKVGNKIILNLDFKLEKKFSFIGKAILKLFPNIKSVYVRRGGIVGEFRKPQIKLIAGEKNSVVEHFENGTWFVYDIKKIMFAKGNVSERGRLAKIVKEGEVIVDMFVGIGYFSLPIACKVENVKIYGIDLNPDSIFWLKEGIKKNKLGEKIIPILGDSKDIISKLIEEGIKVDRVLMGYLPPPEEFIFSALSVLKEGGIIHYDALIRTDFVEEDLAKVLALFEVGGRRVEIINPQRVKSYRPKVDHYVVDLRVY